MNANKVIKAWTLFLLTGLSPLAQGAVLKMMDVASLPGEKAEIKLSFDSDAPVPRSYSIERPARIAVDLPGTTSELPKYNDVDVGHAKGVTVVQATDRTRVVINLSESVDYETRVEGSNLFVLLGGGTQVKSSSGLLQQSDVPFSQKSSETGPAKDSVDKNKSAYSKPSTTKKASSSSITNIDFERGANGEGNVIIRLAHANIPLDMSESGGKIKVEFPGASIPASLRNRLDVIDFATPVHFVDISQEKNKSVITVESEGYFDYLAYQTDDLLTISVKPLQQEEVERLKKDRFSYTGEKLSLNFQDIDVRSVLQLIADFTDLNLVASDTVTGSITLRLQNVPWDQALDLILKAKGLDKRQAGNVLMVAPAEEIAARERQELENQKQIAELAPLYTEVFRINYHDAGEIFELFKKEAENTPTILSDRGEVIVDARSNSIILKETQDKLDEFRRLLSVIDIPVQQVLIEARIINADDGFSKQLGVKWTGSRTTNSTTKFKTVGGINNNLGLELRGEDPPLIGRGVGPNDLLGGNVLTDLSVTESTAAGIGIGILTNSTILNLELTAAAASSKIEIISQPKVITSDKTTAKIKSGEEIPYEEATSSGATSISFKEAALSLEVTPQITPEGRVIMKLLVNNDARGETTPAGPAINTQEVDTVVLVDDGDTLVIGGVFDRRTEDTVDKVPFLGDLPVIGRLFRRDLTQDSKRELLMFITPKILDEKFAVQ